MNKQDRIDNIRQFVRNCRGFIDLIEDEEGIEDAEVFEQDLNDTLRYLDELEKL